MFQLSSGVTFCTLPPNIVIKSRMVGWVGHVARTREKKNAYRILAGNLKKAARNS
jgi:hypothetical protein